MTSTDFLSLIKVASVLLLIVVLSGCVMWVRRSSIGVRAALGGMLMLAFGAVVVLPREAQTIEETKESKAKKGTESGDPPAPSSN